ncbi:hypothetical protein Pla52o_36540 [Novipirellula galeiformis]|uniref:Uncharacterized protein n=1 Tax=Novipirellula galeiformis TaxID=2528004 RepID=A0A5C6CB67_9BACT|nr:hypothetical protein Pla52o_36540 [Novipirellula galeiformis]
MCHLSKFAEICECGPASAVLRTSSLVPRRLSGFSCYHPRSPPAPRATTPHACVPGRGPHPRRFCSPKAPWFGCTLFVRPPSNMAENRTPSTGGVTALGPRGIV